MARAEDNIITTNLIGKLDNLVVYNGQPDSYIQIRTVDDFEVKEVAVTIQNSDGTEVEGGAAVLQEGNICWRYTTTAISESLPGDKIIVRVPDIYGNNTELLYTGVSII